jgi:acetoin utilization deacetylase AcuC-like enzyme
MQIAAEVCGDRLVSALEGGYNIDSMGRAARAHVQALAEQPLAPKPA